MKAKLYRCICREHGYHKIVKGAAMSLKEKFKNDLTHAIKDVENSLDWLASKGALYQQCTTGSELGSEGVMKEIGDLQKAYLAFKARVEVHF